MRPLFIILFFAFTVDSALGQDSVLTIDDCYRLATANYPEIKKHDLVRRTAGYSVENAGKSFLPQLTISGQATYQSETISFPKGITLPGGGSLAEIGKDQYRLIAEVNQQIYDGGTTHSEKALIRSQEQIRQQQVDVSLYEVKARINQLYFSILMLSEQIKQNDLRTSTLQNLADRTDASVKNGTAYKSSLNEIRAEQVQGDMMRTELAEDRTAFMSMLSVFINRNVDSLTRFVLPTAIVQNTSITRPELSYFDLLSRSADIEKEKLNTAYRPRIGAFVQGGYGRPTLNIIENSFGPWFVGGLKFTWSLGSLYTIKHQRSILDLQKKSVDADRETFLFNTKLSMTQIDGDISKFQKLIKQDNEAIELRALVTKSAEAQLQNGVITTHDYITQLNAENMARQTRILHSIQLIQARYNHQHTVGQQ